MSRLVRIADLCLLWLLMLLIEYVIAVVMQTRLELCHGRRVVVGHDGRQWLSHLRLRNLVVLLLLLLLMVVLLLLMLLLVMLLLLHGKVESNGRVHSRMVVRVHVRHLLMMNMVVDHLLLHHQWLISLLSTAIFTSDVSRFIEKVDLPVLSSPCRDNRWWLVLPSIDKVQTYAPLALSIALSTVIAMRHCLITLEMAFSTCQTARPYSLWLGSCSIVLIVAIVDTFALHFHSFPRPNALDFFVRLGSGSVRWRLALLSGRRRLGRAGMLDRRAIQVWRIGHVSRVCRHVLVLQLLDLGGHLTDVSMIVIMVLLLIGMMVLRVGVGFVCGLEIRVDLLQLHVRRLVRETRQRARRCRPPGRGLKGRGRIESDWSERLLSSGHVHASCGERSIEFEGSRDKKPALLCRRMLPMKMVDGGAWVDIALRDLENRDA